MGKSEENIELLSTAITEFKKHQISVSKIEELITEEKDLYLKSKLNDLKTVYENFEKKIMENYIDEDDVLSLLYEKLDITNDFKDTYIYIEEFSGFTIQEYKIIEKLLMVAKQVTVTIVADDLEENTNPATDIFHPNKQTAKRLIKLAKEKNIKIEKEINLNKTYRFKTEELQHLEKNMYNIKYEKYQNDIENIQLFLANNLYSEIEYVGSKIIELVRDNGYKYKDISIITKNLDTYSSLIKAIFNQYEIPVFIDEKRDLSQNILVKYVLSILDIFSKNWSYESVFNYIKSGLIKIDIEDIFMLENYALRWGIKGKKWNENWKFGETQDDKKLERINELRKQIIEPLNMFKNKVSETKTAREISKAIYDFLIDNNINEILIEKIEKLNNIGKVDIANEYQTSWQVLLEVLDEIVLVFNDEKMTFDKYGKILKIGLSNKGLRKNSRNLRSSYLRRY